MKEIIGLVIGLSFSIVTYYSLASKIIDAKTAVTFFIFSLAIGVVIANHDVIKKLKIGDLEVEMIKKDIENLKVKIEQSLSIKQQITTVVNNITEVQKEIADIKEYVHQHYGLYRREIFRKVDKDNRIAILENPKDGNSVIFFELKLAPEPNSVVISDQSTVAPSSSFEIVSSNIIKLQRGIKPAAILSEDTNFYEIRYVPIFPSPSRILSLRDFNIKFIDKETMELKPKNENK